MSLEENDMTTKLGKTALLAALLAGSLTLAGCGGSDDKTPDPAPMPTPEEDCLAGGGVVYEDGKCKSADDLREEGAEKEGAKRDEEAAKKTRLADARKFHGYLTAAAPRKVALPANQRIQAYADEIKKAEDGVYNKNKLQLKIGNTMGSATQTLNHDGTNTKNASTRDVDNAALTKEANAKHVSGSMFATGKEVKSHDQGDVPGSYKGAIGKYTCSSEGCTSQRTANGIKLAGSGWSFMPYASSKYSFPDADYAEYGWWIDETDVQTARVGAWYAAPNGDAIRILEVANSSGTASYDGTAIGVAAYHHSLGGDANAGGAFTADAMLSANFDTNTLSGSITNFDVGGHSPDWSVALDSSMINAGQGGEDDTGSVGGGTTTWTIGGTDGTARNDADGGGWSAQFYDIPAGMHQPAGVAGGFKARYDSDGYMVGAFGAEQ
jgi:hypothetical protein